MATERVRGSPRSTHSSLTSTSPLLLCARGGGAHRRRGRSHKADHNAYNNRLDGLSHPVFAEQAARFAPTFDDIDLAMLDEIGVGAIMRGWREVVWRNAELLVAAKTPGQRRAAERVVEEYAATQARLIRSVFVNGDDGAKRDA